jgi:pimeloyl-ACP methyl ester carboxylesterase
MKRVARALAALLAVAALALAVALATADPEPLSLAEAQRRVGGDYAALEDGPVRYDYDAPDASRPLLVLVHGGALNSLTTWDPLVDALGGAFGVLRFDSYGQGYSARPEARHDAALYVRQIDGLLAQAGVVEPIHLVGYSMGGLIAAEYAAHCPQRVASLALLAPAGLGTRLRWPVRLGALPVLGEAVYRLPARRSCSRVMRA